MMSDQRTRDMLIAGLIIAGVATIIRLLIESFQP
jgi:hypothetical protein